MQKGVRRQRFFDRGLGGKHCYLLKFSAGGCKLSSLGIVV